MMVVTEEEITKFTTNLSRYEAFDIEVVTQARANRVTGTRPTTTPPTSAVPSPAIDKFKLSTSPLADAQMSYDNFPETRSEENTSELQSLMRISYAVFCLKKKTKINKIQHRKYTHNKQYQLNN